MKKCTRCLKEKSEKEFRHPTSFTGKDTKTCEGCRRYNRSKAQKYTTKRNTTDLVNSFKTVCSFENCNESRKECLDFLHNETSEKVHLLSWSDKSDKVKLKYAMENSILLCVMHHRQHQEQKRIKKVWKQERQKRFYENRKALINSYKANKKCNICNLVCDTGKEYMFDLDHIDPSTKKGTVADMWGRKREDLITEIKKCRVLCANCHRSISQKK